MRVFGRALVLGFTVTVCVPGGAVAAPIGIGDQTCTTSPIGSLVSSTTQQCRFLQLDPLSTDPGDLTVSGTFESGGDVALFAFSFTEATQLVLNTTSWNDGVNFDPTLGLYYGEGTVGPDGQALSGQILNLPDPEGGGALIPARFFELSDSNFNDGFSLTFGPGSYVMAMIAYPNLLHDSLQAGFDCDGVDCALVGAGTFSFSMQATVQDPNPVPEPGTLTLIGGGALAGLIQRRRSKKRNRSEPVSR